MKIYVFSKLCADIDNRGYMAPDYATHGHLSEKVDTYSFGVVCLEIISGRRCTDENFSGPDTPHLIEHVIDEILILYIIYKILKTISLRCLNE